jgi:hypothetical protein
MEEPDIVIAPTKTATFSAKTALILGIAIVNYHDQKEGNVKISILFRIDILTNDSIERDPN